MTEGINVNTRARDLVFNIHDSCNCCCFNFKKKLPLSTHVFVQENGEVVIFDYKKATDKQKALKKCLDNFDLIIGRMAKDYNLQKKEVYDQLKKRAFSFDKDLPSPLTVGLVKEAVKIVRTSSENNSQ